MKKNAPRGLTQINAASARIHYIKSMDHQFCPGARMLRQPKPEIFSCPACGEEVEIWSDEIRGVCLRCGQAVFRDGVMSCLEWCKYGRDCVGEETYSRYLKNRTVGLRRKLLEAVRELGEAKAPRLRRCEAVLGWAEEILKENKADWHIVIPAAILHNIEDEDTVRQILLRAGFLPAEIDRICAVVDRSRLAGKDESIEYRVVHDAGLLARRENGLAEEQVFLTDTGRKLAETRLR
jgi:hypothetical protein